MLREDYTVYRQLPGGETTSYVVHAGCYKTRPNSVITPTGERFEYASPEETSALMADLVNWYNSVATEGKLTPVELAAMFHYRYIRTAFDSETKERMVIYQALYGDKQFWVRPEKMFFEVIERDGKRFNRFTEASKANDFCTFVDK